MAVISLSITLSRALRYPKSRTGGRSKVKIGGKEAHDTSDP